MGKALILFVLTLSYILLLSVQTMGSTVVIGGGVSTQESIGTNAVGIVIENLSRFDKLIGNCSAGEFIFGVDNEGNKFCGVDQVGAGGGGGNTTEEMQDAIGSGFTGNLSYDDAGNKFDVSSTNLLSWLDNIYLRISNLVSLVGNWSLDKPNYANYSNVSETFAQYQFTNNNFNGSGNFNTTGWIQAKTINASEYFYGQPLQGSIGSGIIRGTFTNRASLNVTVVSGLNISYPAFTVRLVQTGSLFAKNYDIPAGYITVQDDANSIYYIDNNGAIQREDFSIYEANDLSPGGVTSFMYVMTHTGQIENLLGASLLGKVEIKLRQLTMKKDNMQVFTGFDLTPALSTLNYNVGSGEYQYIRDIVATTNQNITTGKNGSEVVYHTGFSTWGYNTQYALNVSTCDTGTGIATCSGSAGNFRRHFVFIVGYNNIGGIDYTEIHQLLPLQSLSYSSLANCMDTSKNPLSYTIPTEYVGGVVMLYSVCLRRTDTNFDSTNIIDLRTTKQTGASGGVDTTVFLRKDGSVPLTANWDVGNFNITNISTAQGNISNFTLYHGNGSFLTGLNQTNTSYYLTSNPSGYFNTSNTNNCTAGQYVQNLTLNSSGAFGMCSAPSSTETLWNANYSTFLTHIAWSNIINGTIWGWSVNGTLLQASQWNATNTSYRDLTNNTFTTYLNLTGNFTITGTTASVIWNNGTHLIID